MIAKMNLLSEEKIKAKRVLFQEIGKTLLFMNKKQVKEAIN